MPELPDSRAFTIAVGSVVFRCQNGRHTTAVNEPDVASGLVCAEDIACSPADWSAPARVAIGGDLLTHGDIIEARPQADGSVSLEVRSAGMLSESLMSPMVCQNLTPQEIVYAAAREAGFSAANTSIEGLAARPVEPMWVVAPITGVRVKGAVRAGMIEIVDTDEGLRMLRRFSPPLDAVFTEPLESATAFARVAVVAKVPYDAEQEGLALIDTVAAWLTTRLRYSWSHAPDGSLEPYERTSTRVSVERLNGVGVLAVDGPRRWWRASSTIRKSESVPLDTTARWARPPMPAHLPQSDRQALLTLRRAATAADPIQRVAALWEAIEFYVGRRKPETLFAPEEVASIVDSATNELPAPKAARVRTVLKQFLNQASITARLEHALDEDDVPFTPDDVALLASLRQARNRALHGGSAAPDHRDVDRAVAFMSRAMTTRLHRGAEDGTLRRHV